MPDITDPLAVRYCNEKVRVYADSMVSAYEAAKKLLAEWQANGLVTLIPDTTDVVIDGAATDGRSICTGNKVNALIANATNVVTWFDGGSPSRIERFRQLAANGRSPF